ncbi:MAG: hypothetical protein KDD62_15500, partial [Bdellovibrionales bacterium]|nr:hypothetical protein [Bdellovibrionales bacterium]
MQSLLAKSNVVFVTALSILLLTSSAFVCSWLGVRNVPEETPIGRQAEVAWSLAHGGGLQAPEFFSLIEDIKKQSENSQSKLLQDVIALGPHGEFYPKHPY